MTKYIISNLTQYDHDRMLWESHVGSDSQEKPLLYSVWGNTVTKSRANAEALVRVLQKAELAKTNNLENEN